MSDNHIVYDAELCHEFCRRNRESLAKSKYAGCFYCCRTFSAKLVVTFKKDNALCPHCGYDAVIPDNDVPMPPPPLDGKSQFPQPAILMSMNLQWFNRSRARPA